MRTVVGNIAANDTMRYSIQLYLCYMILIQPSIIGYGGMQSDLTYAHIEVDRSLSVVDQVWQSGAESLSWVQFDHSV